MGQIKNIKLHIVTDIKWQNNLNMAPAEEPKEKKEDGRKNNGAHLRVPDELKKTKKYVPTGKPRGRRKGQTKAVIKAAKAALNKAAREQARGKPRGRPKKTEQNDNSPESA